jgi:hypothetical protein
MSINISPVRSFLFIFLILLLAACGPADEPEPTRVVVPGPDTAYPAADDQNGQAYPAPTTVGGDNAYPPPRRIVNEAKRFTLDEPVSAGQTTVSGTGPASTPIKLISVSFAGEELAFGTTDESGIFSVDLIRPAEENEILGVTLGDESMRDDFLDAPGTDIPLIGFILAQTVVQP